MTAYVRIAALLGERRPNKAVAATGYSCLKVQTRIERIPGAIRVHFLDGVHDNYARKSQHNSCSLINDTFVITLDLRTSTKSQLYSSLESSNNLRQRSHLMRLFTCTAYEVATEPTANPAAAPHILLRVASELPGSTETTVFYAGACDEHVNCKADAIELRISSRLIAISVKFTSTSSNWAGLLLKPLEISTKYEAREVSTNAQYNVGSKSFVPATPASKTNHMAAVHQYLITTY
ncbi:hypothetical protein RB195_017415 [Necator americanus]|uniref:Uncharacterized protein n=1 Tax=Necator americanus TaxID=51031 RepID=A0ABR1C7I5_NECAM